jgi:hypothetical protein
MEDEFEKIFQEVEKEHVKWQEWKKHVPSFALAPDIVLRYFINPDPKIEEIFDAGRSGKVRIVISEITLIDALNALNDEEIKKHKLIDLLQSVEIIADPPAIKKKFILDLQRVEHLREVAMELRE